VEQKVLNVEWPLEEIRRAAKNGMDQKSLKEESRLTTGTIEIMCNNPYGNSISLEVIRDIYKRVCFYKSPIAIDKSPIVIDKCCGCCINVSILINAPSFIKVTTFRNHLTVV
jgi:hypothetical protein